MWKDKLFKYVYFILLLSFSCEKDGFELPLSKNNVWYYDVQGYMSFEKYAPPRPDMSDSLSQNVIMSKTIPGRDTVKIYITDIKTLSKDSIIYKFNENYIRYWGSEIHKVNDGYKKNMKHRRHSMYFLKYPLRRGYSWNNEIRWVSETCKVTTEDTTITIDGNEFNNCIGISIMRETESGKSNIEVYFNEKFGLVYYNDHDKQDEIKLLKMEQVDIN